MAKRILICCDGTWNNLERRYITNVGLVAQAAQPTGTDGMIQIIYYDDGVGAHSGGTRRVIEGAMGVGLERNIYEAYRFLCFNYEEGDEICLFGFSRGAYTVRSLAGMIGKAGLVRRRFSKQIPEALERYRDKGGHGEAKAKKFRAEFGEAVPIKLLGCWDTVGALGIPDKVPWLPVDNWLRKRFEFHDMRVGPHVEIGLHAVAIDEERKEFDVAPMKPSQPKPADQRIVQVWFPGDHCCVGGGSWSKRGLSNGALRWLVEEARKRGVQLGIDLEVVHDKAITDPLVYFEQVESWIYGEIHRKLTGGIRALDDSAKQRWRDLDDYRPETLNGVRQDLKAWAKNSPTDAVSRHPLGGKKRLTAGEFADVRVIAKEESTPTRVMLEKGKQYRLSVGTLQMWKDGDLDPGDATGWSVDRAWKDGQPADPNFVSKFLIKLGTKDRLVRSADWMELVYTIGRSSWKSLKMRGRDDKVPTFEPTFTAAVGGELQLSANDFPGKWGMFNKFGNNEGWIWVRIERL